MTLKNVNLGIVCFNIAHMNLICISHIYIKLVFGMISNLKEDGVERSI